MRLPIVLPAVAEVGGTLERVLAVPGSFGGSRVSVRSGDLDWVRRRAGEAAIQAEASGFDVAVIGVHVGPECAPMPTMVAIASATTSIRLGTNVINSEVSRFPGDQLERHMPNPHGSRASLAMVVCVAVRRVCPSDP